MGAPFPPPPCTSFLREMVFPYVCPDNLKTPPSPVYRISESSFQKILSSTVPLEKLPQFSISLFPFCFMEKVIRSSVVSLVSCSLQGLAGEFQSTTGTDILLKFWGLTSGMHPIPPFLDQFPTLRFTPFFVVISMCFNFALLLAVVVFTQIEKIVEFVPFLRSALLPLPFSLAQFPVFLVQGLLGGPRENPMW